MLETITAYFESQGLLGIIILMLIGVVVWQQKRIDAKDKQITDLQDKRKSDTDIYTSSYTTIVKENIATQKDSLNANIIMQRSLDTLVNAFQTFVNK